MAKSRDQRTKDRRPVSSGSRSGVVAASLGDWLTCFDACRRIWPEVKIKAIASEVKIPHALVHKAFFEGEQAMWCPGPILAVLSAHAKSPSDLDEVREELVTATLHGNHSNLPRYRFRGSRVGECIGRGTWQEVLQNAAPSKIPSGGKFDRGVSFGRWRPPKDEDSEEISSGHDPLRSSLIRASLEPIQSSAEIFPPVDVDGLKSWASALEPPGKQASQQTNVQVNIGTKGLPSPEEIERLREAAKRSGLDLSQFAHALRTALLQEMELLAHVRAEALSTIKGFRSLAEMMRRRMTALATKMREDELRGFPSVNAGNLDKELRHILQFLEIQKRMGQITDLAIDAEQKRVGDSEAWRRRTDILLFGAGDGSGDQAGSAEVSKHMDPEQEAEIVDWLGAPQLLAGSSSAVPVAGAPTQNSPKDQAALESAPPTNRAMSGPSGKTQPPAELV